MHDLSATRPVTSAFRACLARRTLVLLIGVVVVAGGCNGSSEEATLSLAEVARACVITSACGLQPRPRVSNCVDYFAGLLSSLGLAPAHAKRYSCVLSSGGDCAAAERCFGAGAECTRDKYRAVCEGALAKSCDLIDDRVYALDCGASGLGCEVDAVDGWAANCVCKTSFAPICQGRWAIGCVAGEAQGRDCAAIGQDCVDGACVPRSAETCKGFAPRCEGAVAVICIGGLVARVDCAARQSERRCEMGACVPSGTECSDELNSCDGGRLKACLDGRWELFDCAALGLGPCKMTDHGSLSSGNCTAP